MSDWKADLHEFFYRESEQKALKKKGASQAKLRIKDYIENIATPAYVQVQDELRRFVELPEIRTFAKKISMHFFHNHDYLIYRLRFRIAGDRVIPEYEIDCSVNGQMTKVVGGQIKEEKKEAEIAEVRERDLIASLLGQFKDFVARSNRAHKS